eukprot:gene12460-12595_t
MSSQENHSKTDSDVASLVARIFSDIREEMDSIVDSADIQGLAAALRAAPRFDATAGQTVQPQQQECDLFAEVAETPILQLHGRTYSTAVGYYDDPLPTPEYKLPEVLPDEDITSQPNLVSTAEATPVMLFRIQEQGYSGEDLQPPVQPCSPSRRAAGNNPVALALRAVSDCNAPSAEGPCRTLTTDCEDDAVGEDLMLGMPGADCNAAAASPLAQDDNQLDPPIIGLKVADAGTELFPPLSVRLSPTDVVSIEELMGSPRSIAAALAAKAQHSRGSTTAGLDILSTTLASLTTSAAHNATDWGTTGEEVSARVATSHLAYEDLWDQPVTGCTQLTKAISIATDSRSMSADPWHVQSRGGTIQTKFNEAAEQAEVNAAINSLDQGNPRQHQDLDLTGTVQLPVRDGGASSSGGAPSGEAAVANGGTSRIFKPQAAAATARAITVAPAADGVPSGPVQDTFARLYRLGVHQQFKRMQSRPRSSITQARLTEEDWKRVSQRLFDSARQREERLESKRRTSEKTAALPAISCSADATQAAAGTKAVRHLALAPAAFHQRQSALLLKRAQWAQQKKPDDEEDLKKCTFHPRINASSRKLHRSISELHRWDSRRQHQVAVQRVDKMSHEFDSYTFVPVINNSSRRIALESYAAAPDPGRPWTASPVHTTAPDIKQYTPPRSIRKALEQELDQEHYNRLSISSKQEHPFLKQDTSPGGNPLAANQTSLAASLQAAGNTARISPWQVEDCQGQDLVIRQVHLGHSEPGQAAASSRDHLTNSVLRGPVLGMSSSGTAGSVGATAAALADQQLNLPEDAVVLYIPEGVEVISTNLTAHLQASSNGSGAGVGEQVGSAVQVPAVPAVAVDKSNAWYNVSTGEALRPIRIAARAQAGAVTAESRAEATVDPGHHSVRDFEHLEGPDSPACIPGQRVTGFGDSAECSPTTRQAFKRQGASGTLSREHLQPGQLFRGDSAGQMVPATHRKGVNTYTLVTASPKSSPLSKAAAAALLEKRQQPPMPTAVDQAALSDPSTDAAADAPLSAGAAKLFLFNFRTDGQPAWPLLEGNICARLSKEPQWAVHYVAADDGTQGRRNA